MDEVEASWAAAGILGARRAVLRADLAADLEQARADGASVEELVAEDPVGFARRVAAAGEVPRMVLARRPAWRFSAGRLLLGLLGGAAVGFVLALFTIYPWGMPIYDRYGTTPDREIWISLGMHVVAAVMSLAGALAFLAWAFPVRASATRTLVCVGLGVLVGGLLSIWPTMALADALDYSFALPVVLLEVVLVVGMSLAGALMAWKWLQRTPREATTAS